MEKCTRTVTHCGDDPVLQSVVFKLSSARWQKNVWTGREQGGRAGLWRESVCQTSSAVCPVAFPLCEAVMGERALPSFLPSFLLSFLPSLLPSAWLHLCIPLRSSHWIVRSVSQAGIAVAAVSVRVCL